jgi:peptidyl-prolyl cis-trans isomerase D
MLQAIRDKAQGWIAWAIVILISIPFALWGIQEYLGVGGEPKVAVVDGEEITQRMLDQRTRDFRDNLRASLGDAYRADLFEDATLKPQVRDAMIEEFVLAKFARDWNLRTADAQARGYIASIPAFQRDGRFDQQLYDGALRNRGLSPAGFEESVRQDLAIGQLRNAIRQTGFITEAELQERVRLNDEQRTVRYMRLPSSAFRDQVVVDDDALRAFYDANTDRYRTAERVRLAYLTLDVAQLTDLVEVNEEALQEYFVDHRSEFVAREERQVRHILVAAAPGDDEAATAAQAKASELLERLQAGEDFAVLAAEHSDDPGSASNGGDLGWIERGMMVPAFEEAAFGLAEGSVSEPVKTEFGVHLIEVTGSRGGSDAGFEDFRDQVDVAYRRFEAENLYFEYAERLVEIAFENAGSLTPAAEALGLTVIESDWLDRNTPLPGVLASPRVIDAAFSDDVLLEGNNSDLIEVAPQQAVVLRILEHELAGVRSFDDHRAVIEQDFIADQASQAATDAGEAALQRLAGGETALADLAGIQATEMVGPQDISRTSRGLPAAVVDAVFAAQRPLEGAVVFTGAAAEGDFFIVAVDEVRSGDWDNLAGNARESLSSQLVAQQTEGTLRHVVEELRDRTDIELLPIGD